MASHWPDLSITPVQPKSRPDLCLSNISSNSPESKARPRIVAIVAKGENRGYQIQASLGDQLTPRVTKGFLGRMPSSSLSTPDHTTTSPGPKISGCYRIIDEAHLHPVARIALATCLFLCHLSDPIVIRAGASMDLKWPSVPTVWKSLAGSSPVKVKEA